MLLAQRGLERSETVGIVAASFVVAKAMTLSDRLGVGDIFGRKALIYTVLWKTFIYTLAVVVIRYIEHLLHLILKHVPFEIANQELIQQLHMPRFWIIHIWLLILIFYFCASREVIRKIGSKRFLGMFFKGA